MSYLVDTNVISEMMKARPNEGAVRWLAQNRRAKLYLSVLTIGEIDRGILKLPDGDRRAALQAWRDRLTATPADRILPIDLAVAAAWARLVNRAKQQGRTLPVTDALIAATAEVHGLEVVTRNARDFEVWGGSVLNPWS